jgi:hypothetical protein
MDPCKNYRRNGPWVIIDYAVPGQTSWQNDTSWRLTLHCRGVSSKLVGADPGATQSWIEAVVVYPTLCLPSSLMQRTEVHDPQIPLKLAPNQRVFCGLHMEIVLEALRSSTFQSVIAGLVGQASQAIHCCCLCSIASSAANKSIRASYSLTP